MMCFIVPVTEAVVVTIVDCVIQKKDKNLETVEAREEKQEGKSCRRANLIFERSFDGFPLCCGAVSSLII